MQEQITIKSLYNLDETMAKALLEKYIYPWEALKEIKSFILELGETLPEAEYNRNGDIWIHKTAKVAPTASINGPVIIGENAEIRHCAYIRGSAIIGNDAVVGNSTELKNSILFNKVQVPHYNYVGDSILGYKAHMGAGSITSNIKSDRSPVVVCLDQERVNTELIKMGAMIGDLVEVGCNSVLNPGTVVGKESNIYPLSMVRGFVPANSIYKKQGEIALKV